MLHVECFALNYTASKCPWEKCLTTLAVLGTFYQ